MSSESIPVEPYDAESLHEQVPPIEGSLRKKDLKRLQDATRPLDSWERYRALVDSSEEAYDLIDTSNQFRARGPRQLLVFESALQPLQQAEFRRGG